MNISKQNLQRRSPLRTAIVLATLVGALACPPLIAADAPGSAPAPDSDEIVYTPPLRGAPAVRVGGGSRGENNGMRIDALAPPHIGQSSIDQPRLYWRLSEAPGEGAVMKLVVTGLRSATPALEQEIERPLQPGLQVVDLANYGVRLVAEQSYRWSITLEYSPGASAEKRKLVASGMVSYVPLTSAENSSLGLLTKSPFERAHFFGRVGYWYDCVDAIAHEALANPSSDRARKALAGLMAQLEARASVNSFNTSVARFDAKTDRP